MKYIYNLVIRAFLAILIPFNLFLFIFKPLTIYPVYFILNIIGYKGYISFDSLVVNNQSLIFAPACIAAAAYYLLLLLVLFTKDLSIKKSIIIFLSGSFLILIMNIIRIIILSILVLNYNYNWFNIIHMFFWYIVSGAYVAFIWILLVYLFKIKSIPIYSDLKYLYNKSILKKYL
ncbi:MAG: pacearchaeosortase [Nanoarchaeota archaeon]|nr:pacearchaeosortase [Nanoarchaeota archaeon]MBU0962757.1 pacearchaeosortase [Nanoarchaeota archaeon]